MQPTTKERKDSHENKHRKHISRSDDIRYGVRNTISLRGFALWALGCIITLLDG